MLVKHQLSEIEQLVEVRQSIGEKIIRAEICGSSRA
jgi:hypothetical protein